MRSRLSSGSRFSLTCRLSIAFPIASLNFLGVTLASATDSRRTGRPAAMAGRLARDDRCRDRGGIGVTGFAYRAGMRMHFAVDRYEGPATEHDHQRPKLHHRGQPNGFPARARPRRHAARAAHGRQGHRVRRLHRALLPARRPLRHRGGAARDHLAAMVRERRGGADEAREPFATRSSSADCRSEPSWPCALPRSSRSACMASPASRRRSGTTAGPFRNTSSSCAGCGSCRRPSAIASRSGSPSASRTNACAPSS